MMNVKADDFFMKKFQDFIQKHVNGHWGGLWDKFLALWSSGTLDVDELLI